MQAEIEAKFLRVDHDALRARLDELGAVCVQPMRLMRRKVYDFPDRRLHAKRAWVRIRDEGDKITTSFKHSQDSTVTGTGEICVTIDNFDRMDAFYRELGLEVVSYQETKRESWRLGQAEIELDEWPWVQPFIEFETPDEAALKQLAGDLGLSWDDALHGGVSPVYMAEYEVGENDVNSWPEITFTPVPKWLKDKRKANV